MPFASVATSLLVFDLTLAKMAKLCALKKAKKKAYEIICLPKVIICISLRLKTLKKGRKIAATFKYTEILGRDVQKFGDAFRQFQFPPTQQ